MELKTTKELWALIESSQWTKDHDYERIAEMYNQLPGTELVELEQFTDDRVKELYDRYKNDWLGSPGINASDDSWHDLLCEVVGRGEEFYNDISVEKLRRMADENDYQENFLYSFH